MDRRLYLLLSIAEECEEVAQRIHKLIKFGSEEKQPGQDKTNDERLWEEIIDLDAVIGMCIEEGYISEPDQVKSAVMVEAKKAKVNKYCEYSIKQNQKDPAQAFEEAMLNYEKALGVSIEENVVNETNKCCGQAIENMIIGAPKFNHGDLLDYWPYGDESKKFGVRFEGYNTQTGILDKVCSVSTLHPHPLSGFLCMESNLHVPPTQGPSPEQVKYDSQLEYIKERLAPGVRWEVIESAIGVLRHREQELNAAKGK